MAQVFEKWSSTDLLFGEDLQTILSWIDSDYFDESPKSASIVKETTSEKPAAYSYTEWSKKIKTSRDLQRHFSSKRNK